MRARILLATFLVVLMLSLALSTLQVHAQEELKCDIDEDGEVGPKDLEIVVNAYGSTPGQPSWNVKCDFNNDNKIDASDLYQIGKEWGKTRQGTGILYAYITDYSDQAEQNAAGNYLVYPGKSYNFKISNITEYENRDIMVWARYKVGNTTYNVEIETLHVKQKPSTIFFQWTVPSDLSITTSIKFKYGTYCQGPPGAWVYARKAISPSPRLLLVVPETFLGSIGAIAALFGGFTIRNIRRKRK